MTPDLPAGSAGTILVVGASRGLGFALAAEFLGRGWNVIGTVRAESHTDLHDLAQDHGGRVQVEALDIDAPEQIAALRARLSGRVLDMLFVNAGTTAADANGLQRIGGISTEEFTRVMITNALSPMRVIEALADLVPADGLIGAMSSGQGSIANNLKGTRELYRGSKAALNMFLRSFAAREAQAARTMVLMAPGWIRTDLGGPDAPFTIEETVPKLADILLAARGTPGLRYLDRFGETVPW